METDRGAPIPIEAAWARVRRGVLLASSVPRDALQGAAMRASIFHAVKKTRRRISKARTARLAEKRPMDLSDARLSNLARFTDRLPLKPFERMLQQVPRLVNVVSLAEAVPVPGSNQKLPLDLHLIASRSINAYFAPRRFAAVQLAFSSPRCRVLAFHTGRFVGTGDTLAPTGTAHPRPCTLVPCEHGSEAVAGCSGPSSARLAILRALRQLRCECNIALRVRSHLCINQVGAVSIDATLDCDQFAGVHSSDSHFDRQSFVGLAWRPACESICCEIYSTGRANLPGSTRERELISSFSRMAAELYKFTNKPEKIELIDESLRNCHAVVAPAEQAASGPSTARGAAFQPSAMDDLWDDGGDIFPPLTATGAGLDFINQAIGAAGEGEGEGDDEDADVALLEGAGFF